ncbi:hypothetical protein KC340_g6262 [Hortaea werneckii]|nr:hypothetical protein KC342_g11791 [Hortaea werneckii]KAI7324843.1 hypothetical protein KC340_g6262 [Hortaea werneckii]KAI7402708.1 hypothetical protein KC328_g2669 [Hortaea werneckii]
MGGSGDLIDFNVIEGHKENIQALPSGRSAKALHQLYSPPILGQQPSPADTQDANSKAREPFEKELQMIDEADDPLDVYDRYVKWTLDAYPSAQATPQSRLLPLLERATKALQGTPQYRNDPRYLKLWLHYIRLFSDAPREVFVFLARHEIGDGLALYYEEFAAWLENAGRWNQAEEIYKMGIEKEATPAARLMRKFGEFERRKEAQPESATEPSSPALPAARPALAAKIDPFAASSPEPGQQQQARSSAPKKSKSSKMAIFSDSGEDSRPNSGSSSKGWDNIGTLAERKKENSIEAKPMAGEKLKGGKTNGGMQKLMIFKDQTGRMECVFVNLEAAYPQLGREQGEYCFEELRARHRGWLNVDWTRSEKRDIAEDLPQNVPEVEPEPVAVPEPDFDLLQDAAPIEKPRKGGFDIHVDEPAQQPKPKQRGFQIFEDTPNEPATASQLNQQGQGDDKVLVESFSKTLALNDENDENAPPRQQDVDLAKRLRREERANRTRKIQVMDVKHIKNETKTIQLNMDSPTGPNKIKRKKSSDRAEPTMTINTKEAMDEIYGIFNQPLPSQEEQSEEEDSDDDYTTGDESTATGKLSGTASEYGDETRHELLGATKPEGEGEDVQGENTGWSDFTVSKDVPREAAEDAPASAQSTSWDEYPDEAQSREEVDQRVTPQEEHPQTQYIPVAPEDYEPPEGQFRDMNALPNHRLPFMTPIIEQTESSLGVATVRTEKDYFNATKTPSRKAGAAPPLSEDDEEPVSSPFQEVIEDMAEEKRKVLQPIRTKSTKGNLSLGQGSAKSQIAAKSNVPSAPEPQQKGPIIQEQQCNPMDHYLRQSILSHIKPSLTSYDGYFEHLETSSGRTAEIRKYIKTLQKASRNSVNAEKTASTLSLPPMLSFKGAEGTYTIKRELGAGTFAPVYLIENSAAVAIEEPNDENRPPSRVGKQAHRKQLEAIKMEGPPSTWEFYILQQSHRRLGVSRAAESIVRAHEMHLFQDECFLVEEYRDQGTLLDLVNIARLDSSSGGGMDEVLAMWFTVELLRTVEAMHSKQLIHGDLKGDNVLVRFDDPGQETDWSPTYFPSGAHGWASKGVCLIDFGRGIDMKQFVPNVAFIADWKTTEADCAEMRELRPWTYQIDYHGLAGIVHSLLFGKYMETVVDKGAALGQGATKTYRIRENLKRYWQTEIWGELFSLLLNPLQHLQAEEAKKMPVLKGMRGCRERMEGWLEENCERGVGLKGMIGRMEAAVRERKRKSARGGGGA